MSISRILTLLAGAVISAAVLRRKESFDAHAKPWRADLDALQSKFTEQLDSRDTELAARLAEFQPKIEALAVQLAIRPDARIEELAAQLTRLQPKIEALAVELAPKLDPRVDDLAARLAAVEFKTDSTQDKVDDLQQRANAQDQKALATNQVLMAIEQLLTTRMADFDQRIEAQGKTLEAINSSITQSDELLERVLDLVQNLSQAVTASRDPISIASGGGKSS